MNNLKMILNIQQNPQQYPQQNPQQNPPQNSGVSNYFGLKSTSNYRAGSCNLSNLVKRVGNQKSCRSCGR